MHATWVLVRGADSNHFSGGGKNVIQEWVFVDDTSKLKKQNKGANPVPGNCPDDQKTQKLCVNQGSEMYITPGSRHLYTTEQSQIGGHETLAPKMQSRWK